MGMFGAVGRSPNLIGVLEFLFHSLCLGDDCKGMPRDRLSEKGDSF
jgi:hypothetical protein